MKNRKGQWLKTAALLAVLLCILSSCGAKTIEEPPPESEELLIHVDIEDPKDAVPAVPTDGSETPSEEKSSEEEERQPETESESESEGLSEKKPSEETEREPEDGGIKLKVRKDLNPDKPMVALTFDDGPSKYTDGIMDLLEEYGGRGTFCVVGSRLDKFHDQLNRMAESGHEIVSHTWNHTNLKEVNKENGKKAMQSVIDYVERLNGYRISFVRPPYGGINDTVKKEAQELGVGLLRWSVDTEDWRTRNVAATLKEVKSSSRNGSIVLLHDIHGETAEAMKEVIPWLVGEGYQLVTVSELLYYQNNGAIAGKVYYNTSK